jgi:hypothetical protein
LREQHPWGIIMRLFILTPLLVLAACSEGDQAPKNDEKAPAPKQFTAGQWDMTSEVTKVTQRDKGAPALPGAEGSKTTTSSCVAEADVKKPQPALFVGEALDCTNRDVYLSRGRVNATLTCKKAGTPGEVAAIINGNYTADSFEGTSVIETSFVGEGDVKMESKLTGRRTGECTAAEGEDGKAAKKGG